jgi:hypothetical protein
MLQGSCHCGSVTWQYAGTPESATACNCTVCRRYGSLMIYGYEGEGVSMQGPTQSYVRGDRMIAFHFCPQCACVVGWRSIDVEEQGKRRMAVNVRLAEPETVAKIPIEHFDGLDTFEDLPRDGRCVADYWG